MSTTIGNPDRSGTRRLNGPAGFYSCASRPAACALAAISLLLWLASKGASALASEVADDFKQFIASPPPIESLIYGIKAADRNDLDAGSQRSTNFQYYVGCWQLNAWYVRSIPTPDSAGSNDVRGSAVFVFEDEYWHLHPSGVADFWLDDGPIVQGLKLVIPYASNPVRGEAWFLKRGLAEALNFGIFNVEPASIHWDGSDFHGYYPDREQTISGRLTLSAAGAPLNLTATYRSGTNSAQYVVRYAYERQLELPFLPSDFRVSQVVNGREIERARGRILKIKTRGQLAKRAVFDPAPFIAYNHLTPRRFTNGVMLARNKHGQWVSVPSASLPASLRRANPQFFYATMTVLALTYLVLISRARKEAVNQT